MSACVGRCELRSNSAPLTQVTWSIVMRRALYRFLNWKTDCRLEQIPPDGAVLDRSILRPVRHFEWCDPPPPSCKFCLSCFITLHNSSNLIGTMFHHGGWGDRFEKWVLKLPSVFLALRVILGEGSYLLVRRLISETDVFTPWCFFDICAGLLRVLGKGGAVVVALVDWSFSITSRHFEFRAMSAALPHRLVVSAD